MAYIETIDPQQADAELKSIYDQVLESRGRVSEVLKLHSLNPASLTAHLDLYMLIMFGKSPLKRKTRELIAVVVSCANQCNYCQVHHAEALDHFWKNENRIARLRQDFMTADLEPQELALARYAQKLTLTPGASGESDIAQLRDAGLSDRAILDASQIVAYFNFVNRLVLGLGAHLEADPGKDFKYD